MGGGGVYVFMHQYNIFYYILFLIVFRGFYLEYLQHSMAPLGLISWGFLSG